MGHEKQRLWIFFIYLDYISRLVTLHMPEPLPIYGGPVLHPMPPPMFPQPIFGGPTTSNPCKDNEKLKLEEEHRPLPNIGPALAFPVGVPVQVPMAVPMPMPVPVPVQIECTTSTTTKKTPPPPPPCPPCLCLPACTPQFFSYCSPCHQICRCKNNENVPKPLPPNRIGPAYMPIIYPPMLQPMPPPIVMVPIPGRISADTSKDSSVLSDSCNSDDSSQLSSCESSYIKRKKRKKIRKSKYIKKYKWRNRKRSRKSNV